MAYEDIKAEVAKADTDDAIIGALCSGLIGLTWGPDSPEMQHKRAMVAKFCKMYLGEG